MLGARGVVGLVALHALTAQAYVFSRRRPARLRPGAELMVHALLVLGIALQAALAVQFSDPLWALVAFPLTLPLAAPLVTAGLYAHELVARLRRRGADALAVAPAAPDAVYRASTAAVPATADAPAHRPTLLAALVTAPALAGLYAVVMAAAYRRPGAALEVFTDTCGHRPVAAAHRPRRGAGLPLPLHRGGPRNALAGAPRARGPPQRTPHPGQPPARGGQRLRGPPARPLAALRPPRARRLRPRGPSGEPVHRIDRMYR